MTTATTSATSAPVRARTPVGLRVAPFLMVPLGAMMTVGALIFRTPGSLLGDAITLTLIAVALLTAGAALRLPRGERLVWNLTRGLFALHLAWSTYKVFLYGEQESWPFLAAAIIIAILLHLPSSVRFVRAGGR
jgi:hypothetical protein